MKKKKLIIIGVFILASLIFAGCRAEKEICREPCKTTVESTTINDHCTTTPPTTKSTTEPTTKCTTNPPTEPTTKCTTKPATEPTAKCPTRPATEPTTKCTNKPTTEPTTKCTTKPTTESTTKCTTKPTTEPTAKCTTEPATEPTTKKQITPQSVQNKINCYIRSNGIRVNHTLTPETAEWSVMISTKDEFLLTGITLKESIEVVDGYISALKDDIACMYCYYEPDNESFYILYLPAE